MVNYFGIKGLIIFLGLNTFTRLSQASFSLSILLVMVPIERISKLDNITVLDGEEESSSMVTSDGSVDDDAIAVGATSHRRR